MNKKKFNKGVLLTSFGSFWWGFFGVIYFKYISFAGHLEVLIHRSVWTAFLLIITTLMFSKWSIFKNILHDKKIALSKSLKHFGMVQDDLFVGRSIEHEGETYLLKGMCPLPGNILSNLKKQSKKVRKLNSHEEEEKFLLELERLKIKSLNYGHIDANKIFIFK